jgi:hypothetical protein
VAPAENPALEEETASALPATLPLHRLSEHRRAIQFAAAKLNGVPFRGRRMNDMTPPPPNAPPSWKAWAASASASRISFRQQGNYVTI